MSDGLSVSISELIALKRQAEFNLHAQKPTSKQTGQFRSPLRGRGMEFSEVRNYQAGDEIRHMEWRITARTGRPHVKLFHEERERPVFFIVDFNPSMFFGTQVAFKSVIAARLFALLAWRAFRQGDKVGGILFNAEEQHEFAPNARETALLKCLNQAAEYTQFPKPSFSAHGRPLSESLVKIRRVSKPGSLIILISDFYHFDKACDKYLSGLRQHHDMLAFHLCDPLERTAPKPGLYPFTNQTKQFELDTHDNATLQSYEALWSAHHHAIKEHCQKLGLHYIQVGPTTPLIQLLQSIFPRKRHAN